MTQQIRCRLAEDAKDLFPVKAHADDAAFDLKARISMDIAPGKAALVPTGLFLELPPGYEAQVRPRSGLALKHAVTVLNSPGTIDAGYRGEVGVILFNSGDEDFQVRKGDKVAQIVIAPVTRPEIVETDVVDETDRGAGGFGSTGV